MSGNEWLAVGEHPLAAEGFPNILNAAMHYRNYSNNDLLEPLPDAAPPKSIVRSALFFLRFFHSFFHRIKPAAMINQISASLRCF